jgi:hypothetical protein
MPTRQRESGALPVRDRFRLAGVPMGASGDDTRSVKRENRLSRTPFAAGRYLRLLLAARGNGRQR